MLGIRLRSVPAVTALVLLASVARAPKSHAQAEVILALAGIAGVALETTGTIGAIRAGVLAAREERAAFGWLLSSYFVSVVEIGTGSVLLYIVPGEASGKSWKTATGLLLIAWGGAKLGLTIWGNTKPSRPPSSVSLVPIVGDGIRSRFAGIGLRWAVF